MKTKQTLLIIYFLIIVEIMQTTQSKLGIWVSKDGKDTDNGKQIQSIEVKQYTEHNKLCHYGAKLPDGRGGHTYEKTISLAELERTYTKPQDAYISNSKIDEVLHTLQREFGRKAPKPTQITENIPIEQPIKVEKKKVVKHTQQTDDSDTNTLVSAIESMKNANKDNDNIIFGLSLDVNFSLDKLIGLTNLMGFDSDKLANVITDELTNLITDDKIYQMISVEVKRIINEK